MKKSVYYILITVCFAFSSFNLKPAIPELIIIDSNKELNLSNFKLEENKIILAKENNHSFYFVIKVKNVTGKKLEGYSKIKRTGKRYKLSYIYEYIP